MTKPGFEYLETENYPDGLFGFLDGWCEASGADDMPDGAWQTVMMEGVEAFNEEENENVDPHDGWLAWANRPDSD